MQSLSEQKAANQSHYRWLMQLSKNSRNWLMLSIALGVVSGLLLVAQAGFIALMIGRVANQGSVGLTELKLPLLLLLVAVVTRAGLAWLREWVGCKTALCIKSELRLQLMEHLLKLSPAQSKQLDRGQTMTAVMEQVEALHNFFASYLPQMSLAVLLPIIILICIFPLSWVCGLVLLVTAPLIPIFMALVGMGAESAHQKHFKSLARLGAYFLNTLQGLSTLKVFGASKKEAEQVYQSTDDYRQQTMKVLRIAFLSSAVLEMFSSVAIAMVAVYLGLVLLQLIQFGAPHGMVLASALFILLLAPEFYLPLRQLATHYHAKAEAVAAAGAIREILNTPIAEQTGVKFVCPNKAINIECEELCFGYNEAEPLLKHISFAVKQGECVAIKGQSGSGKSTLLRLVMGLLEANTGQLLVNGLSLKSLNVDSWMQSIAWIGQGTRLFPDSLRNNLLMANPNASESALQRALSLAHLDEFVASLPRQLETTVGENNVGLSGGQVQRIALARAYLKDAPLLILDEPTASLDIHSEKIILAGIQKLRQNKTVLMVSHREETLAMADKMYHLEQGMLHPQYHQPKLAQLTIKEVEA